MLDQRALEAPDDVFHLKLRELEQVGTWPPPRAKVEELRALVTRRKERRAALEDSPLIDPRLLVAPTLEGDVVAKGTPGSA